MGLPWLHLGCVQPRPCTTGDCGGSLLCNGLGGTLPATLAEIALGNKQDFYDVSLIDGYNLAISITPIKGSESEAKEDEDTYTLQENYALLLEKSGEYARVAKAAMKKMKKTKEEYKSLLMTHRSSKGKDIVTDHPSTLIAKRTRLSSKSSRDSTIERFRTLIDSKTYTDNFREAPPIVE
nr:uncharacterized protein LOC112024919 [Quercus suber]